MNVSNGFEANEKCDLCNRTIYQGDPHVDVVRRLCEITGEVLVVIDDQSELLVCWQCDRRIDWAGFFNTLSQWVATPATTLQMQCLPIPKFFPFDSLDG